MIVIEGLPFYKTFEFLPTDFLRAGAKDDGFVITIFM